MLHSEVLFGLAGFGSHVLDEYIYKGTVLLERWAWDRDCAPIILGFTLSKALRGEEACSFLL